MAMCGDCAGSWRDDRAPLCPRSLAVMRAPFIRWRPALCWGQSWEAHWGAGAGTALASLLPCCFLSDKVIAGGPGTEQDLDISKCFLKGVSYRPSHSDLLLPPDLLSCGLFPGPGRTGRYGGGAPWGAQEGGEGKGSWLHPPLPTPILALALAPISPLRPRTPDKLFLPS